MNGDRFELDTGFPIRYIYNGADQYGYISYWGLSLYDDNAPLVSGDTLFRDDASPASGTEYELLLARGKLTKHYTLLKTLSDFLNMKLEYEYWDYAAWQWDRVQLQWDGSTFNKVGVFNYSTYTFDPVTPAPFDLSALTETTLNLYSKQAGNMQMPLTGCQPYQVQTPNGLYTYQDCSSPGVDGAATIKMRQAATVKPTDTAAMADLANGLLCFRYCPDGSQVQSFTQPYYHYDSTYEAGYPLLFQEGTDPSLGVVNAVTYSFDPATMLLRDESDSLDVVFGTPPDNNYYYLNYGTGPLIANTPSNKLGLACDTDPNSTCADKADTVPVYYTWQTGSSSGYHLALLRVPGTSNYFIFDEPLPMSYTHKGSGEYYGQTFSLTYYGFHQWLSGIPSKCVDPDTWDEIVTNDCYGAGGRQVNAFNIPFGGKLAYTQESGAQNEYFAKALSKEQYMLKLDDTTPCNIITVQSYTLPDPDTGWQDPSLGPTPVISAAPAVVDGELQTSGL